MSEAMISFPANPCGCGHDRIAHVMMEPPYKCGIPDCPCEAFHHPRFAPMTDATVTSEIRKLADTIVQRYLAHPDGSFYAELMAQIEPLIASAIAQVLQDERAKRGAVIADAIDIIEETMGHNRTNLSEHDGCLTCRIVERVRALDPEATQAWDAPREPRGTQACPICSENEPHFHLKEEIYNWLKAQATRFGYNVFISDSALCPLGDKEPCLHMECVDRGMKLAGRLYGSNSLHRTAAIIGNYLIEAEGDLRERERKLRELVAKWRELGTAKETELPLGHWVRNTLRECSSQLEAVLAETEGQK